MAAMRLQCGACDRDLPASAFHASAAKRRVYCCRACVSNRNREYHKSKQGAVAAALWATKHVLKSTWASHLRAKDVETALKLHGHPLEVLQIADNAVKTVRIWPAGKR